MNVFWSDSAEKQLDTIYEYLAQYSEKTALETVDRVTAKSIQISSFPLSGRKVPEFSMEQIREVIEYPYRIVYYTKPEHIEIIAVVHGAQNIKPIQKN